LDSDFISTHVTDPPSLEKKGSLNGGGVVRFGDYYPKIKTRPKTGGFGWDDYRVMYVRHSTALIFYLFRGVGAVRRGRGETSVGDPKGINCLLTWQKGIRQEKAEKKPMENIKTFADEKGLTDRRYEDR